MEIRLDGNLHGFRTRLRRSRRLRQYNLERLFRGFCIRLHRSRSKNTVRNARRKQRNHGSILPLPIKVENRSIPSGFLHIGSIFAGSTRANHRRLMEIRLDGNLHGFRTRLRRSRRQNAVRNARRKQRNHGSILPLPIKVENRSVPSGFLHIGSIFAGSTRANHRRLMEIRLDGNLHGFRTRLRRSRRLRQYTLRAFFVDSASVYIGQGAKMRSGTPGESRRNSAIRCIHRMAPFVFRRFRISYLYL